MNICSKYIAEYFGCLSLTLELPIMYKKMNQNAYTAWAPEQCRKIGESNIIVLNAIMKSLITD